MRGLSGSMRARRIGLGAVLLAGVLAGCGGGSSSTEASVPQLPKKQQTELELAGATLPDGTVRDYTLYVPEGTPAGVLIVLDSYSLSLPESAHPRALLLDTAKAHDLVLAVPKGIEESWNAERCCGAALIQGVDDVGFVTQVAEDLSERFAVPRNGIHLVGWGNGGLLAYRLACEAAERFGTVTVVEGVLLTKPCRPAMELDLLQIHQRGDSVVPFGGTTESIVAVGGVLPSVRNGFERWLAAQSCGEEKVEETAGVMTRSAGCRGGTRARLIVVDGGSDAWPTGPAAPVDATAALVEHLGLTAGT